MDLKKKNCLVTGGSRGIGKAIALKFAQLGANVAITYSRSKEAADEVVRELETKGVKATSYQADAVDFGKAEEVISDVMEKWGSLDVLVNNAGITRDNLILRMDEKSWDDVISTNLKSVFNYSKAATKPMMRARGGSIINISSVIGISGNAGQCNYAASKSGIIGFTKSVAKELGSRNIRANVVAPGFIRTEMTEVLDPNVVKEWEKDIPLKRAGEVDDVANVCLFLASDLSAYVTGQTLSVCGGML